MKSTITAALMGVFLVLPSTVALADGPSGYSTPTHGCLASWVVGLCTPKDYSSAAAVQQCWNDVAKQCVNREFKVTTAPHFLILSLIYAPPGCGFSGDVKYQCKTVPSVSYTNSSTVGTKVSISESVKNSVSMGVSIPLTDGGTPFGRFGLDEEWTTTSTDGQSISFSNSNSLGITSPAIPVDGIDHDNDTFEILVNPLLIASGVDRTGYGHHLVAPASWNLGYSTPSRIRVLLKVSELRHPETIDPATKALLDQYGWTADDYLTILEQDPIALGKPIDTGRYVQEPDTLPYAPALESNCIAGVCTCDYYQYSLDQTRGIDTTHTSQFSYAQGMSLKFGSDAASNIFTASDTLTLTNASTYENSSSKKNVATLTLGCASPKWTGASVVDIYWDTLYGTFMFSPHRVVMPARAPHLLAGVRLSSK